MHDAATDLMRSLARIIRDNEEMADHLFALADWADVRTESDQGDRLADTARMHRVKAITLRARLGVLVEEYGARHLD